MAGGGRENASNILMRTWRAAMTLWLYVKGMVAANKRLWASGYRVPLACARIARSAAQHQSRPLRGFSSRARFRLALSRITKLYPSRGGGGAARASGRRAHAARARWLTWVVPYPFPSLPCPTHPCPYQDRGRENNPSCVFDLQPVEGRFGPAEALQ